MNVLAPANNEHAPPAQVAERRRGRAVFRSLAGSPAREYFVHVSRSADEKSPVVVLVHGITRNAAEHIFRFGPLAEETGAILVAPLFAKEPYGQYQQLADPKSGVRADVALLDILKVISTETGASTERVHLFGFSGGAQFAHRFMMLHPKRVAAVAVTAAGWYTLPSPDLPYPMGIGSSPVAGRSFEPDAFLRVPRHVLVGGCDLARDESLRVSRKLDLLQGETRLARARTWFDAMEAEGKRHGIQPASSFTLLDGAGHSFTEAAERHGLTEAVFNKFGLIRSSEGLEQSKCAL